MSDGVMIAYLPTDGSWCKQSLPHMTLVYAGALQELPLVAFNNLAKDAISAGLITRGFQLPVIGIEEFGDEDNRVDVLKLHPTPQLMLARQKVEYWNTSEHPFNPHATIGPAGSARGNIPRALTFDRIMVAWGNEELIYNLEW